MFSLYGHDRGVSSVVISRDCKLIASGSADETVRLWNLAERKIVISFLSNFILY